MNNPKKYKASDKLKDLISDNSRLLMVLNRFGIPLGFGEKTVAEDVMTKKSIFLPF